MSGSSPPPLSSQLTHDKSEPPLTVEMWGLLKALATQLHVCMELATSSSSSSTSTEPSPAQDSRRKDKAPASPEDSEDEDKDMSKSVQGGKSSSLAQGSDAPLYDVGLLNPRAESLSNTYMLTCGHARFYLTQTPPSLDGEHLWGQLRALQPIPQQAGGHQANNTTSTCLKSPQYTTPSSPSFHSSRARQCGYAATTLQLWLTSTIWEEGAHQ